MCTCTLCILGLRHVVECSSTRTVDNYSGTISRTRLFGKKKNLSRPTLTRAWVSGGRWHGAVGKNVSQLKHCQTHHSETGTKCLDFCLDLEENGLFCHLWFLKQQCLLLLLLLNRRLQLQLEVKLHTFSATELGYCCCCCSFGIIMAISQIWLLLPISSHLFLLKVLCPICRPKKWKS